MTKNNTKIQSGLSSHEAELLHKQYGYNETTEHHTSTLVLYARNFWGPLPWLLEATILIAILSRNYIEAIMIAALLIVNSLIGVYQSSNAARALALLREQLQIKVRVLRDGSWTTLSTPELVPGDIIRLRTGDVVPADLRIVEGDLSVNVSSLTGESVPQQLSADNSVYAGGVVERGEATAKVLAIGAHTKYGKITEILETSHPPTRMEQIIWAVIKGLFGATLVLIIAIVIIGIVDKSSLHVISNLVIALLLTSVPVAFPTMFTIAQSYGALQLSKDSDGDVLIRRLAAVQSGAMMDILCADKTGTLTQNKLEVSHCLAYDSSDEAELLTYAAACSDVADMDAIDAAVIAKAKERSLKSFKQLDFVPFDPHTKRTRVTVEVDGRSIHVQKGLPSLLAQELLTKPDADKVIKDAEDMSAKGLRVIVVMANNDKKWHCVGLVGLADPLREDAPKLLKDLHSLGIRPVMITGDSRATAQAIAEQLHITGDAITAYELRQNPNLIHTAHIFSEVYPEDKLHIVKTLQDAGYVVGMTGDGVNDAPALKQADMGIAVAGATDVAKQSASLILTQPGLSGIIAAITESRHVNARIHTWIFNKIIRTISIICFVAILFLITRSYVLSPLIAVLLLVANDFVTISIATDRSHVSKKPAHWHIDKLMKKSLLYAVVPLATLFIGYSLVSTVIYRFAHTVPVVRSAIFLLLLLVGQSSLYVLRSKPHFWKVHPSKQLAIASMFAVAFGVLLTRIGYPLSVLPLRAIVIVFVVSIIGFFVLDAMHARLGDE